MFLYKTTPQLRQPERRKTWSTPAVTTLELGAAEGAVAGALCDKHGSLSIGSTCH